MIFWRTPVVAGISKDSDRWDRRERFFSRTSQEHQLAFSELIDQGWRVGDPFLPLHSTWWFQKLSACQVASLPIQWTNTAWSGIFLFLRSLSETYGKFDKVPFSQILLKDPEGCYAKISLVKLKVVYNGASHRIIFFWINGWVNVRYY